MPTLNRLPAKPTRKARHQQRQRSSSAWVMKKQGIAVSSSIATVTTRPPTRSVSMPAGSRHSEPLSTATALIQASCGSERPSSFWIGTPRMPNISQTANIRVKRDGRHREHPLGATGDVAPTGIRAGGACWATGSVSSWVISWSSIWMNRIL